MDKIALPRIIEPEAVHELINDSRVVIVDMCDPMTYKQNHIPSAAHLEYARIVRHEPPVMGLMPAAKQFSSALQELGINEDSHIIAYDDEGGGKASRFLWTLEACGHKRFSLLNGGFYAWFGNRLPFDKQIPQRRTSDYNVEFNNDSVIADREFIMQHINRADTAILDARTTEEYNAVVKRALRGGHIPGAVNFDWMNGLDLTRNKRMRNSDDLLAELAKIGVTADKEVIVYCHTHHRSAYTYQMLKALGFARVRGYPGSWSDWGNHPGTPIEQ